VFTWKPEMSVGHAALDEDHKSFFFIASLVHDAAQKGGQNAVIESALNLLQEYAAGHFLREEKAMIASHYPDLERHTQEHARFVESVVELVDTYRRGNTDIAGALAETTATWVTSHILNSDMKYKDWIKDDDLDKRPLVFLTEIPDVDEDDIL